MPYYGTIKSKKESKFKLTHYRIFLENLESKDESSVVNLKIVIEHGEDGYFVAHCPSLKSCWSQGKTREDALKNVREAIDLFLEPSPTELVSNRQIR